jgi:hypothetical protein
VFSGLLILVRLKQTNKNNNYKRNKFFGIFYKKMQTRQSKETKQNNNKVKRLEVRDSPCRNPLSPWQWRQKIVLMSHRTRWETPRGRYDEHNSKFSLSMKPKFNRPVGERNHF